MLVLWYLALHVLQSLRRSVYVFEDRDLLEAQEQMALVEPYRSRDVRPVCSC